MRLAIVATHPIQYYAPVFQLLAKQLNVKVFYTSKRRAYDQDFKREICWDIPLLTGYKYEWQTGKKQLLAITDFCPQCILIYGWAPQGHLQILRHFKNKAKIIFRGDSTLLKNMPWWKGFLKKATLNWVYSHVDTALYTGTNNKAYFLKYGLQEAQLKFAPHAIDNERFALVQPRIEIRKCLGIAKNDLLVLFTGKFNDNKNVLLLLQAFVEIGVKNTHLLFTGSGRLENKLKLETSKYANVHLLPFQNQTIMPAIYQACDLFCLPSKNESWGLSINEAMACGKAVLVSDQCGAAIDLVNQENGGIFKTNELDDFKQQLKYLLKSRQLLNKAGRQSRQRIREWSFKVQVENIITSLYDKS